MKHFFSSLPLVIITQFTGRYLLWNITAVIMTYLIAINGIDWYYFLYTREAILLSSFFPAIILGAILPVVVPIALIIVGHVKRKKTVTIAGWALGQAALAGSLISSTYKAFTGRTHPDLLNLTNNITANFDFGFWNNGIFWGWPSSHTTIAFAMAFTLIQLYSKNKLVLYASLAYALYIGIGVSLSVHWFSDFLAGAIIGAFIGIAVGKNFREYSKIK